MLRSSALDLLLVLVSCSLAFGQNTTTVDVKRYSYICLEANQNLCAGISPGPADPVYVPGSPYYIQLKPRLNNELMAEDYKKTRWDVRFDDRKVSLSRFPNLCMANDLTPGITDMIGLFPCDNLTVNGSVPLRGQWALTFQNNINQAGEMQVLGTQSCLTVMRCASNGNTFCDAASNQVAPPAGAQPGAYLKIRPCWWSSKASAVLKTLQVFRQQLDCAVGCSPMLQNNQVCDLACANYACKLDNGYCVTAAPTPPTLRPTKAPSTKTPTTPQPSRAPTPARPSAAPSTRQPTMHPSMEPTAQPTTVHPTPHPTAMPTALPTTRPSDRPSLRPSAAPSRAPSATPTKLKVLQLPPQPIDPEPLNTSLVVAVTVPLLLLLLLCCLVFFVVRERRRRANNDPDNWKSPVNMNRNMYAEHWDQKRMPWCV